MEYRKRRRLARLPQAISARLAVSRVVAGLSENVRSTKIVALNLHSLHPRQHCLDKIERTNRPSADKGFTSGKIGGCPGQHGSAADAVEDVGLAGRELRLVAADRGDLLLQRLADIDREMARIAAEDF